MSTSRNIWREIFQDNETWTAIASSHDLKPVLVGQDLYSVREINPMVENEWIYTVLIAGDPNGDTCSYSKYLFDSLRPHSFDRTTNEVVFMDSKIKLNIHDALCHTTMSYLDPERLFSQHDNSLVSACVYWQDENYEVQPFSMEYVIRIESITSGLTTTSLKCGLALKRFEDFKERYPQQNFNPRARRNRFARTARRRNGLQRERPIYSMPRIDEE